MAVALVGGGWRVPYGVLSFRQLPGNQTFGRGVVEHFMKDLQQFIQSMLTAGGSSLRPPQPIQTGKRTKSKPTLEQLEKRAK